MAEVTYYFDVNGDAPPNRWANNPLMIVDGILTNYASTVSNGDYAGLRETTCPGTDLGTITKVEIRVYAYGDGDDRIDFAFDASMSPEYQTTPGIGPPGTWGSYVDVTADTYIGGWTWAKVAIPPSWLFVEYAATGKSNMMYCAKVEIRVTYTPGNGWANIAKVSGVTSAAMGKMNGVAVAAIAKVRGVAV